MSVYPLNGLNNITQLIGIDGDQKQRMSLMAVFPFTWSSDKERNKR